MNRSRVRSARHALTWSLVAASLVTAGGLVATDAEACFGTPRPPACARSTTLLKVSPAPTVLVPAGATMVSVPIVVRIALAGACPPPLSTTVTLTSTGCVPGGPGGSGSVTFPSGLPGTYAGSLTMTFGAGPARICTVVGTATTTWADGVTTSGTGDAVVCLVDPAPGDPSVPRLDVERLSADVIAAHPGDQALYEYRITNNDPTETVEVMITADSEQTARLGSITGVSPASGDGTYAIADPGTGDNFPIAFIEDLVPTPPPGHNYLLSDGTAEQQIGLGNDGAMIWLNQFDVLPGQEVITKVCAAFGTVPNGRTYSVAVYDDPDNDGDPSDAVLLTRTDATVAAAGSGTFEEVVIVPTVVGPAGDSFFVGVIMQEVDAADSPALL
ncbi:MAG: hypothetical protein KJO43_10815, partial [Phycisphaerae bacterium]|nr:hypothetical protein [Phycisphaerae bacterium]